MSEANVTLLGCGDVGPIHEPAGPYSALVRTALADADIRFANCERIYSDRGAIQPHAGNTHSRAKPELLSVFSDCGFDVASVANNHAMDWGVDALLDNMERLQKLGIQTVGGGRNLREARQPARIEKKGVKIAILAYCSVLREGYAATADRGGIAPLRVHTSYRMEDYQPGMPPLVITQLYPQDLAGMVEDITATRKTADIVIVSMHWGIQMIPRLINDYQPFAAQAAFDAGADLILGHHAHIPQAVGVYGGKVCFYSLSHFIHSSPPTAKREFARRHRISMDPDYPHLDYGVDGNRTLIAKAELARDGVKKVSFLPVLIDKQLRPEILHNGDPRFDDAVKYMDWTSEWFDHKFTVEGNEVTITAPKQ